MRITTWSLAMLFVATGAAAQTPGQPAPAFTVADANGKPVALADYKGKYVVLEWTNPECPFVKAQYVAETMQALQRHAACRDVVWLSVNSTSQGHYEFKSGAQMSAWVKQQGAAPASVLIDSTSETGRKYAARTTPHMFVIDPAGKVVYNGRRSSRAEDHKTAKNYVRAALDDVAAGRPVALASTTPYGCSVKY
jgi:peroxiredoxin